MKVTEAIQVFLKARQLRSNADLVARWSSAMETQLNVAAGDGEPVEGKRTTYSNGINEWWNIRLPKNANDKPTWTDYELRFPFELHAEGIGCTGWDWQALRSRWVAFDFDSITTHAKGIGVTDEELERVKQAAEALPYVETHKSTSGSGLHLYVFFDAAGVPTDNHTEHAALARCILGMMSSETGFDFASQIDCCGGIMWIWHRKMTPENQGLALIKPATKQLGVADLPANWRDHIEVVQKKRSKVRVNAVEEDHLESWEALASSRKKIPLDDSHKAQIEALMRSNYTTLWIPDHHLLQSHTCALKKIKTDPTMKELKLVGCFDTNSEGKDPGSPNCFLFPLPNGAWKVYRFSQGVNEAASWEQDGNGWTTCYFNRLPSLAVAAKAAGGLEDGDKVNEFVFDDADKALEAAATLGVKVEIMDAMRDNREIRLKPSKGGGLLVEFDKMDDDDKMPGWLAKKSGRRNKWTRVFDVQVKEEKSDELGFGEHDNLIREIMTAAKESGGWMLFKDGDWFREQSANIKMALQSLGMGKPEAENIMGEAVRKSWTLVDLPFQQEYPGGRQWNLDAAQLAFQPAILGDDEVPCHPTWDKVLEHVGADLNEHLRELPWAQRAGIKTGAQYLLAWIACMIRFPFSKVPYLFLYGPVNSGKSIYHEAIEILLTKGCVAADRALTNASNFNGELANCILAYVEEVNVALSKGAYDKMKDWITSLTIAIRKMRCDQYSKPNTTHWVQCANDRSYCPIYKDDNRITMIYVSDLLPEQEIPKEKLLALLKEEAPHFMYSLMNYPLPEPTGRMRLPVVETSGKKEALEVNGQFVWACQNLMAFPTNVPEELMVPKNDLYVAFKKEHPDAKTYIEFCLSIAAWVKDEGYEMRETQPRNGDDRERLWSNIRWKTTEERARESEVRQ